MALSPYAKLGYTSLRDLKMPEIPFDLLDETLSSIDQEVNITEAALLKSPDYIRESDSDRKLAEQINNYQQQVRDQLAQVAASGDTRGYVSALKQAQQRLYDIYRPGGAADALGQRLKQYQAGKEQISKDFEGDQEAIGHFTKKLINDIGYQNDGKYSNIKLPDYVPTVSAKEFDEWANRNLDNIKDTILYDENGNPIQGMTKKQIDGITSIVDLYELKGVTPERVQSALLNVLPKEYIRSFQQDAEIRGQEYDPNILTADNQLNPNNPVASKILGYSQIASRQVKDRQRFKIEDKAKLEAIKQKNRKDLEDYKNNGLRIEGQGIRFNPQTRPKDAEDLNQRVQQSEKLIDNLTQEYLTTTDPQRRKHIDAQIKWAEMQKGVLEDIQQQASAQNRENLDKTYSKYGLTDIDPQQLISITSPGFLSLAERGQALNEARQSKGLPPLSYSEARTALRDIQEAEQNLNSNMDNWIEENAKNYDIQLGTIGLNKKEKESIKGVLNTNQWTFFDESGPIMNEEATSLFGTDKKPIVSENVEIESISPQPLGDMGHAITLSDKNTGKVYYAFANNSNVGEVVGKNIIETTEPGSDQHLAGLMMANPQYSKVLGQLTDFNAGDTRKIVSGNNVLGEVKKSQPASGTLYELTVPNIPSLFKDAGETIPYGTELELAKDLNIINQQLNQTK